MLSEVTNPKWRSKWICPRCRYDENNVDNLTCLSCEIPLSYDCDKICAEFDSEDSSNENNNIKGSSNKDKVEAKGGAPPEKEAPEKEEDVPTTEREKVCAENVASTAHISQENVQNLAVVKEDPSDLHRRRLADVREMCKIWVQNAPK
mmetsp:Transcript_19543/g.24951  ORF Transcript_19543/g.24951 Transcript_19543/m.24951 type:complete len:148 (-) Transcript_19543:1547-1990(-)